MIRVTYARLEAPERCTVDRPCKVTIKYRVEGEFCQFVNAHLYINGQYDSTVRVVAGPGGREWRITLLPRMPCEFDLQAYVEGELEGLSGPVRVPDEVYIDRPIGWNKKVITCFYSGRPRPGAEFPVTVQILYGGVASMAHRLVFDGYLVDINRCASPWRRQTYVFRIPGDLEPGKHYIAVDAMPFDAPLDSRSVWDRCLIEFTV